MSGCVPFPGQANKEVLKKNKQAKVTFKYKYWKKVAFSARHLIKKMLWKKSKQRSTASECLQHPWIQYHKWGNMDELPHEYDLERLPRDTHQL